MSSTKLKLTELASTNLLLHAVIVPGASTSEGRIFKAVTVPWLDIIALIKENPSLAYQISPDKWEEIVAGSYKKSGFDEVILTHHEVVTIVETLSSLKKALALCE